MLALDSAHSQRASGLPGHDGWARPHAGLLLRFGMAIFGPPIILARCPSPPTARALTARIGCLPVRNLERVSPRDRALPHALDCAPAARSEMWTVLINASRPFTSLTVGPRIAPHREQCARSSARLGDGSMLTDP